MKKLDQIRRSDSEDICVLLRDVQGAPHVQLRGYRRSESPDEDPLPGTEAIAVPVNASRTFFACWRRRKSALLKMGWSTFLGQQPQKSETRTPSAPPLPAGSEVAPAGSPASRSNSLSDVAS